MAWCLIKKWIRIHCAVLS